MNITTYIKETRAEMAHVKWPSRKMTIAYSALVIIVSVAVAVGLGFFDYVFSTLLKLFV